MVDEDEATGVLADLYKKIAGSRGGVANVMKVHSLNPRAMEAHFDLYKVVQFGRSPLSRKLREMIGTVVSAANRCRYCVAHHSEPLRAYNVDDDLIDRLCAGEIPLDGMSDSEHALLTHCRNITREPVADEKAIESLRLKGWSDQAILDATLVASYFNFVNRIVETLGVELEKDFASTTGTTLLDN